MKYTDPAGYQIAPRQYLPDVDWDRNRSGRGRSWMANFGEPGCGSWQGMFSDGVNRSVTPHLDRAGGVSNRQYATRNISQVNQNSEIYDVIYIGRANRFGVLSNDGDGHTKE